MPGRIIFTGQLFYSMYSKETTRELQQLTGELIKKQSTISVISASNKWIKLAEKETRDIDEKKIIPGALAQRS